MNNLVFSTNQHRRTNKNGHKSPLLPKDTAHLTKELKSSDQTHNIVQKDNSQTNFSSSPSTLLENSARFEMENYFDSMLQKMTILPLHSAIEPILTNIYTSYKSILWISKDSKSYSFYSPTLDLLITGEDTLLAAAARAKTSILSPAMIGNHIKNSKTTEFEQIESQCSKMFFPLYLKNGNVISVAEVMRTDSQDPFNDHDLKKASFLMKKFLLYGSALFNPSETASFASEFSHIAPPNNLYQLLSSALIRGFNCKMVDFWCHRTNSKDILKLDPETGEFVRPQRSNIGVVIAAIRNKTSLNAKCPRYHPNFSFNGDPLPDDPILISTYEDEDCIFAAVLRGKRVKSVFSAEEESKLEAIMPFISRSLLFSINIIKNDIQQKDPFEIQLTELLDSAALFSTQLNIEDLVKVIQERSIKMVNAKSCRFILYDNLTNQFVFDNGNANLPGNIGLTGNVANFGSPIRISSPMSDPRFNNKIDLDVHQLQEIDSMLIVPVYSLFETVIGVLSLVNKINSSEFTEEDEKVIISVARLSSISLQNTTIFKESIDLTQKLNNFVRIKKGKNKYSKNKNESILLNILKKALDESKVYRVTLFLSKENTTDFTDQSLLSYYSIGCPPEQGIKFSLPAAQQRKQISYPINDDFTERVTAPLSSRITRYSSYQTEVSNPLPLPTPSISPKSTKTASISQSTSNTKVDMGTSPSQSQSGRLICCTPILNDNSDSKEIVGILEIGANSINTAEEIDLFQNFCNIVIFSIRKEALKEMINIRNEQFSLHETIPDSERELFTVPSIFKEKVPGNVFSKEFDITNVDSQFLFNVSFSIFEKFDLMNEFKITASKLFLFFYRVKSLLKSEKEWRHSIEVACFISYLLIITKFNEKITSCELLSMIIASFCHDIEDISLIQNASALDFLYSRMPVFECFSCVETFSLISSPDSNLLENVSEDKILGCKELIIQLILSTDYYKHYSLLHDFKGLVSSDKVDLDNQENRLLVMKILLKCSDVGVIARVRNVADKYQDNICDEFFLHGPYDKAREIVFTSPIHKDRSHIDRRRSKKTIFDSVFAPMFRLIVKIFPQLNEILKSLNDNIVRWTGKIDSDFNTDKNKLGPDRMLEKE